MHLYDVKDDDICVFTDIYEYLMTMDASNAENRGENSIYYQMYQNSSKTRYSWYGISKQGQGNKV